MIVPKAMLGAAVAAALGTVLATGVAYAAEKEGKTTEKTVKCQGVNECKGKGSCKSAKNDCKGQNGCKGQSFSMLSEKACHEQGGTAAPAKSM